MNEKLNVSKIESKPIAMLDVHSLDGNFYILIRNYLEKHKVRWIETRNKSRVLETITLEFQDGTTYKPLKYPGWYLIELPTMGVLVWQIRNDRNCISVPYTYL